MCEKPCVLLLHHERKPRRFFHLRLQRRTFVFSCLRGEATCHQLRSLSIPGRRKLPTLDHASPATFRQLAGMRGPCLSCNSLVGRGKCSAILGRYLRAYRVSRHCTTCLLPSPPAARRGKRAAHICVLRQGIGALHKCFRAFIEVPCRFITVAEDPLIFF